MPFSTLSELIEYRKHDESKGVTFIGSDGFDRFLSYKELYSNALRTLYHLQKLGVKPKDELVFQIYDNLHFLCVFWACILGKIIPVPVTFATKDETVLKLFRVWSFLNNPRLVIDKSSITFLRTAYQDRVRSIEDKILYLEDLLSSSQEGSVVDSVPEDIAFIQFSSGSTGDPKGVVITHNNVTSNIYAMLRKMLNTEDDSSFSWMPLTHDMGLIGHHLAPMTQGEPHYIMTPEHFIAQPMAWLEKVSQYRASILVSPNFGFRYLLDRYQADKALSWDLSCVRIISNGAEPISVDLCNAFIDKMSSHGLKRNCMYTVYGLAEATLAVSFPKPGSYIKAVTLDRNSLKLNAVVREVDDNHPQGIKFANLGSALDCLTIRITDDRHNVLNDYVIGNIQLKGTNVTKGYYNNPQKTHEIISEDGWLSTGDVGFTINGDLFVTGRAKDIIFVNGVNYYSHDIERLASEVEGVGFAKVAAIGVRNGANSEDEIVVFLVYREPDLTDFVSLSDHIKSYISRKARLVVTHVIPVKKIPRTTSGKSMRFSLRDAYEKGQFASVLGQLTLIKNSRTQNDFVPRTSTEKTIAKIWANVLKIDVTLIRGNSTFLELGGQSISAIDIASKINSDLGIPITIASLFDYSTLHSLATYIDDANTSVSSNRLITEINRSARNRVFSDTHKHLPFALTEVQQAYWLGRSDVFELGNVSTHFYFEFEAHDLDVAIFNRAVQKTIDRHDMLRAVILPDGTQQILDKLPPYQIEIADFRVFNDVDSRLETIRSEMSHEVLPSNQWPLFRIKVSLLPNGSSIVHMSIDLLCIDGWSIRIFLNDIVQYYKNPAWQPQPLRISFRDYILSISNSCTTSQYKISDKYWKDRLPSLPAAPELPLMRDPQSIRSPRFSRLEGKLEIQQWNAFKQRSAKYGLTPTSLLLAAFSDVLSKWSKKEQFTINVTLFNRPDLHEDMNDIIGDFTSSLLLEVDCSGIKPLTDKAKAILKRLINDLDHRDVSGVTVIREIARRQSRAANALMPIVFTSMLGYETNETHFTRMGEIGRKIFAISQTPQVWLDHQIYEEDGSLVYSWDYIEDLFPEGVVDLMFETYRGYIRYLSNSNARWEDVNTPRLSSDVFAKRTEANDTQAPVSTECLHTLFYKQAKRCPDNIAILTEEHSFTYRDILNRSLKLSDELKARGVKKNTFVAVAVRKGWEQVVSVLGVLFAGAAYLPVDPDLPEERIRYLIDSAEVHIVLTAENSLKTPCLREDIEYLRVETIPASSVAMIEPETVQNTDDLAYMIFTSGSTGVPKGVMIDHRGAVNTILDINEKFKITDTDRVFFISNLNFDLSVYDIFGTLAAGGAVVIPDPEKSKSPEHWAKLIEKHQVTVWNSVPALMQLLVDYFEDRKTGEPISLKTILLSGDWVPVALIPRINKLMGNADVISLGGATEASIWSIYYPINELRTDIKSIPYGKPLRNQSFFVLDRNLENRPDWVPGELYIGGIGLARGYWKDDTKTNGHFIVHPVTGEKLYRTGDWGRYLPDGNIEFLGREDLQVKINGYRIELGEIESVLRHYPIVSEAIVDVCGPNKNVLAAYIVYRKNDDIALITHDERERDIDRYLENNIPAYMLPKKYFTLDKVPLTSNGKVDRTYLRNLYNASDDKKRYVAPKNGLEKKMVELWQETLNQQKIGVRDNFFDVGGDSALAIKLNIGICRLLNRDIPIALMYKYTTIRSMVDYLSNIDKNSDSEETSYETAVLIQKERADKRSRRRGLRRERPNET
jgi:amino acid adenylation domain-containing protein